MGVGTNLKLNLSFMYKNILIILFALIPILSFSQGKEDEAKAAFLLAEEFYSKSDFRSALGFIEKAKQSLGEGNCKILYLEILIRNEMYKSDKTQYGPLMVALVAFQSSKDIDSFNKDKIIEVLKLKMLIDQEMDNKRMADSIALADKEKKDKLWDQIQFKGWPLNVRFNDLMVMKVNHPFFKEKRDTYTVKDHPRVYHMIKNAVYPTGKSIQNVGFYITTLDSVAVIGVDNGVIRYYNRLRYSKGAFEKEALSKSQAEQYISTMVDNYTRSFGFSPIKKDGDYTWTKNNKSLTIRSIIYEYKKTVDLRIYEIISSTL